jgi:hypothetical protein
MAGYIGKDPATIPPSLATLSDVDLTGVSSDDALFYNGASWGPSAVETGASAAEVSRIEWLEDNVALNALRDIVDAGWVFEGMTNGFADSFNSPSGSVSIEYQSYNDSLASAGYADHNDSYAYGGGISPIPPGTTMRGILAESNGVEAAANFYVGYVSGGRFYCTAIATGSQDASGLQEIEMDDGPYTIPDDGNDYWIYTSRSRTRTHASAVQYHYTGSPIMEVGSDYNNHDEGISTATPLTGWVQINSGGESGGESVNYVYNAVTESFDHDAAQATSTLTSITMSVDTAPDSARAIVLADVGAATLNTDVIVEISRDGGTTWTAGTLTNDGDYTSTGVSILTTGAVDISGQPSGTDMRIRLRTANSTAVEVHGWTLQWS